MALEIADRIRETTTTSGTGTLNLAGAVAGFRTFVAGIGTANTCHYLLLDGVNWEVGIGTVTDATPDTLSRDTVISSSNGGAKISLSGGEAIVSVTLPGSKSHARSAIGAIAADSTDTLTTKTIALGSNTVSGTMAQFDSACSDGNFAFQNQNATFGDLATTGNTTIGDGPGDTLTFNAGTWTIANNVIATRAMGVAPASAGTVTHLLETTFTGDPAGTSDVCGYFSRAVVSGANNIALITAMRGVSRHSGSALVGTMRLQSYQGQLQSTGNVAELQGILSGVELTSSGSITGTANLFDAGGPGLIGAGTIGTLVGFNSRDLGHATKITNAIGHDADNMTVSATLTASYRSQQNTGTGARGFLHTGTAANVFNGPVKIGATTDPVISGTGSLDMAGDTMRLETSRSPTETGTGNRGDICTDANYLYVATALNTWKRTALDTFSGPASAGFSRTFAMMGA